MGSATVRFGLDRRSLGLLAALAAAAALPLATSANSFLLYVETSTAFWAAAAIAWYVFGGIGRYYLLGSGAFLGTGAYVTVLLNNAGYGAAVYLPASAAAAALVAIVMAPLLKLTELFFALATLVIPLILGGVANFLSLSEVPLNGSAGAVDLLTLYYVLLGVTCLYLIVAIAVDRGLLGMRLRVLSESEVTAAAAGIDPVFTKLYALLIVAPLMGILGAFYPMLVQVVSSTDAFGPDVTLRPFVTTIVGGLGSPAGSLLGAMLLVPLSDLLNNMLGSRLAGLNLLVYGIALVLIAVALPDGLYGIIRRLAPFLFRPSGRAGRWAAPPTADRSGPPAKDVLQPLRGQGRVQLQVSGLSGSYGGVRALAEVSFSAAGGEIVGIIGPNGSGKTTLINTLSGATTGLTVSGEAAFRGKSLVGVSMVERARRGVWRSFQHPANLKRLTLAENVALGIMRQGVARHAAQPMALRAIRAVEREAGIPVDDSTLFGVKVAEILRVLSSGAALVMLDEPLAGLSEHECRVVLALIRRAISSDRIVLVVDHAVGFLSEVSDRLIALDIGRIIADGTPADVTGNAQVVSSYLGVEVA